MTSPVGVACAAALAAVIAGCVAAPASNPTGQQIGRSFDIEIARGFVHGVSTRSDVRAQLGEPTQVFYNQNGQEVWQYQFGDMSFTRDFSSGGFDVQEAYFMFVDEILQDSRVNTYSAPVTRY